MRRGPEPYFLHSREQIGKAGEIQQVIHRDGSRRAKQQNQGQTGAQSPIRPCLLPVAPPLPAVKHIQEGQREQGGQPGQQRAEGRGAKGAITLNIAQ